MCRMVDLHSNKGVTTNIHWVAEHGDVAQNELADEAAKSTEL